MAILALAAAAIGLHRSAATAAPGGARDGSLVAAAPAPEVGARRGPRTDAEPKPAVREARDEAARAIAIRQVLPEVGSTGDWTQFTPEALTVTAAPHPAVTFRKTQLKEQAGRVIWIGESEGASLVAVATRDSWIATIAWHTGNESRITISDQVSVQEVRADLESCGTNLELVTALQMKAGSENPAGEARADAAVATMDVLFFYDEMTLKLARSYEEMKSYVLTMVEHSNLDLARSGITNVRWSFVDLRAILPYDDKNDRSMSTDLTTISNTNNPTGKAVEEACIQTRADQVVLLVGNDRTYAGLAWTPGYQCVVLWGMTHMTLAHEMGHNLNCQHDRETEGAKDDNKNYNFGHRFTTARHGDTGTIMSYAGYRYAYFSNPDISYEGNALGIAEGQPKAADNAKMIRERGLRMAATRTPDPVAITAQPVSYRSVSAGGSLSLSVQAAGAPVLYQWRKGGVNIAGATNATLTITGAVPEQSGTYDCVVYNSASSVTSRATNVVVRSSAPGNSRLVNISTRSTVGTEDSVQIAGFVIGGTTSKQVLIRANGPALTALGLGGALADPVLELHAKAGKLETNDDWSADATKAAQLQAVAAQVGAQPWAAGSKDAAILTTLKPGPYSALCAGKNGGTGISLIEVYEVEGGASKLVNISSRTQVGTVNDVQIAGFVITGTTPLSVLVRGSGPDLVKHGVTGVLLDPVLELYDQKTSVMLQSNDDWSTDATAAAEIDDAALAVGALPLARGSKDAAMLLTLNPGIYSIVVKGRNNTTGIGLVEVFVVP